MQTLALPCEQERITACADHMWHFENIENSKKLPSKSPFQVNYLSTHAI